MTRTKQMKKAKAMAMALTTGPKRPRFQTAALGQSESARRARKPSATGMMYARYSATVLSEVTTGTASVQTMATMEARTIDQMADAGVPCVLFTDRRRRAQGVPSSRANENRAREDEVMHESPQNHMAMDASAAIALPALAPSAVFRIAITAGIALPPASLAASTAGMLRIASVKAMRSRYPTTPETTTDRTMPHGARRRGSSVSSAMWAEASKPV